MSIGRRNVRRKTVSDGTYRIFVCGDDCVHVVFSEPNKPEVEKIFEPEEAYDLASGLLRGYDVATGIDAVQQRRTFTE